MEEKNIIDLLARALQHEIESQIKKDNVLAIGEKYRRECKRYFTMKAYELFSSVLHADLLDEVDRVTREGPEISIGWAENFKSLLEHERMKGLAEQKTQLMTRVSESTVAWFISFLKKEYCLPEDFAFPDFKVSELYELGAVIALYYLWLARLAPLHISLKVDILSHEVLKRIDRKDSWLSFRGYREVTRTKKANVARMKAKSQSKQSVVDCYYRIGDITKETKPFTAARMIRDKLHEKIKDPPSIKTVLRYLREEGLIR